MPGLSLLPIAALLIACNALTSILPSTATSAPANTLAATVAPTALDPCQLVTSQEASSLAGTSFGAGREDTTSGGGKLCIYGYQTLNVFQVIVGQAPDVATAQADKQQFESEFLTQAHQSAAASLNVTQMPNFADGAVTMQGSLNLAGQTFSASAIDFLKGPVFVGISDVTAGNGAPSTAALQAEATTVLGRLP
jgi:hypothetical protein